MLSRKINSFLLISLLCGVVGQCVHGQVDSIWNNTTGFWSDSSKWSTALFPNNGNGGLDYNALVGNGSVTLNLDINIDTLTLLSGAIDTSGFDLMMNEASIFGGERLTGLGSTIFTNGLLLSGTTKTLNAEHVLNNSGVATWTAGGFNTGSGAVFNNLSGAMLVTDFDGSFSYNLGGAFPSSTTRAHSQKMAGPASRPFRPGSSTPEW